MSRLKKQIEALLSFGLNQRTEQALQKNVRKKIAILKQKGTFQCYPLAGHPPLIAGVSFYHRRDLGWLDFFYSVRGTVDTGFIPLPMYYRYIEPRLNHYVLTRAIKDKNFYDQFLKNVKTPTTLLRAMNGNHYDGGYRRLDLNEESLQQIVDGADAVIIKPSIESGSGKAIAKFVRTNGHFYAGKRLLDVDYLQRYGRDFVMQDCIRQHDFFRAFNPDSNNTLRVLTYRSVRDDRITVLHTLLRIGVKGSFLDHDNLGGVAVAINESGDLQHHAFDVNGDRHEMFNDIVFQQMGTVPFVQETRKMAVEVAAQIFYGRLLAMDFTVDHEGKVLLIEINCKGNGVSQYQYSNGSLFKDYTQEILEHCDQASSHLYMAVIRE